MPLPMYDVVIVGYGPTGLVCSSLLARQGHRVCAFERWPSLYGQPRIATIDGESARILQAACDVDEALKNATARDLYLLCNGKGDILVEHDWGRDDPSGFPFRISVHQPDIESALDTSARAAGATVQQGWEVRQIRQGDGMIEVSAQPPNASEGLSAKSKTVTARYLIGADGGRSATRSCLGIDQEVWPFRNAWFTVDVVRRRELPNFLGVSPDGRIAVIFGVPGGGSHSVIPLGRDVLRFNFEIDPDVDRTSMTPIDVAHRHLQDTYGLGVDDVEVIRQAVHVFSGRLATRWRKGNVFLAGDAAHAMTPFMGQGGCSALRDAVNLSWKLDLVLQGIAPDSLLDTYETERKPHARVYVDGSDKLGAMVFTRDPAAAAARDRLYLEGRPPAPPSEPRIETGLLHLGVGGTPVPPAGIVGPQGRVQWRGQVGRFDDVAGWGFQVLFLGRAPHEFLRPGQLAVLKRLRAVTAGIGVEPSDSSLVQDIDGVYARFFENHRINGMILRPDFVIHSGATSEAQMSERVDELISQLTGS
jgi:3-(3-hydroxy-phenyl)propionate hydroxylase